MGTPQCLGYNFEWEHLFCFTFCCFRSRSRCLHKFQSNSWVSYSKFDYALQRSLLPAAGDEPETFILSHLLSHSARNVQLQIIIYDNSCSLFSAHPSSAIYMIQGLVLYVFPQFSIICSTSPLFYCCSVLNTT